MKNYGYLERTIARQLDRFPTIRRTAKKVYQRLNYWRYREKGFQCEVHSKVKLQSLDHCWGGEKASYFFGYYDKTPWGGGDDAKMLMHRVLGKEVEIVRVCPEQGKRLRLGMSSAWNHQQGSMTQWLNDEIVAYNDVQDRRLGVQIVGAGGANKQFIPWPIQTVHPSGIEVLSLNYKRLHRQRPEYGYKPRVSNFSSEVPLGEDGLWRVNLETGRAELVLSLSQLRRHRPRTEMENASHRVNHAMYSPKGARVVFMHRWIGDEGKFSRLYVAAPNGDDLRLLMDDRMVSHYSWRDENHLVVWGRTEKQGNRYYLVDVRDGTLRVLGEEVFGQFGDGHPSYAPGGRWIVTDTYPDKGRKRHLLLFDTQTETVHRLGRFFAPWTFDGMNRCDLHPRWSPDGNYISIDSTHEGSRKSYVIDIRKLLNEYE
ncbi:TolB family protein [Salinibacter ruber]|uniref:TolB family protein n=1 Tax=Salinibacter ruber TaxID=146919 RepID=UPI00216896D6|nr:hypothetical protein [Salinibacter ruber]MCS3755663.1 hypothetical protein [Salinibacter ruber]